MVEAHCDIVMVSWNQLNLTRAALESIAAKSAYPYRLIVVDNGSNDETLSFLREACKSGRYGHMLLIENGANVGWLKATNRGLDSADAKYICLINNDIIAGENWLRNCIQLMERHPEIGLVNPRGNERSENKKIRDIDAYAGELEAKFAVTFTELDHCSGFCMVIRREAFDKIGKLDEIYENGYYEDVDYSRCAQKAGYICGQCDDALVFHLGNQSFKQVPEEYRRLVNRNREICEQRWGRQERILLLPLHIDNAQMLKLARQHRLYMVHHRKISSEIIRYRHSNLTWIKIPFWFPFKHIIFLFQAFYLSHKKRIDRAIIQFN